MNSEELKKENKNSRKYVTYFFYCWIFSSILLSILFVLTDNNIVGSILISIAIGFFMALIFPIFIIRKYVGYFFYCWIFFAIFLNVTDVAKSFVVDIILGFPLALILAPFISYVFKKDENGENIPLYLKDFAGSVIKKINSKIKLSENINSKDFKKENKNSRKYIAYFFCGWMFFTFLMSVLLKWGNITTDLMWGLILFILFPVFPALFITPLIALVLRSEKTWVFVARIKAYLKRILFPIYLFPIKLVTYSLYYLIKFIISLIISLLKIIRDFIVFPFRSFKNFLKAVFISVLVTYVVASFVVNVDYLKTHYGWNKKFFTCTINKQGVNEKVKNSVVRIVGGYSEGSGFFIKPDQIVTNFHVISGESSPKIIFPDGNFITPERIIGDKNRDLAIIFTKQEYPDMVMDIFSGKSLEPFENEALFATGYAMGTDLIGSATQLKGNFMDAKRISGSTSDFIRTNISMVSGMSGGPLTDLCGTVIGVNTLTVGGTSLFIPISKYFPSTNDFTDKDIKKMKVFNPATSPEEAVKAFYSFLKARKMKEGFNLLSQEYLLSTDFKEWNNRFANVIDVDMFIAEKYEKTTDTVFIKFITKNWINDNVEMHYYEGTWKTISEDGVYKMLKSNIKEVLNPEITWFYE
jgi:hypothetical protein